MSDVICLGGSGGSLSKRRPPWSLSRRRSLRRVLFRARKTAVCFLSSTETFPCSFRPGVAAMPMWVILVDEDEVFVDIEWWESLTDKETPD